MPKNRIDQPGHQKSDDQITVKPQAFGHRARDDSHGGAAEHGLENQKDRKPGAFLGEVGRIIGDSEPAIPRVAEHQTKSESPEDHDRYAEVGQILESDVDVVLVAGQAGFQAEETALLQ